jgi:hypothetical protein
MWRELPTETRNWSEEDWEAFFRKQDESYFAEMQARSWEHVEPPQNNPVSSSFQSIDDLLCAAEADTTSSEDEEIIAELDAELSRIPAWRAAVEFCDLTMDFVTPVCEGTKGGPLEYSTRTLCSECYLVTDYILAGHEIGYEEDTLCGNIALCLRSIRSLDRCLQCLERLGSHHGDSCRRLIVRGVIVRTFIDQRVAELRAKVWWR